MPLRVARAVRCPRSTALTLCLITDRRRLARALHLPVVAVRPALVDQVRGAIRGGVDVVQIREADLDARDYRSLVDEIVVARSGTAVRVFVNDRLDVALAAGADGVHLRESSVAVSAARKLTGSRLWLGRSVHRSTRKDAWAGADYLIAGSVFQTQSKPGAPASLELAGLRDLVTAAGTCPVWAVGGVTPERVREVVGAGARGVAAIGGFIPLEPTVDVAQSVEILAKKWRFSFDSAVELF